MAAMRNSTAPAPRPLPSQRPLFRRLTGRQWLNLLWAALAAFYFTFGGWYVATGGLCDYMGADYRAFYASARIATEQGFAKVYDLQVQDLYQRPLFEQCAGAVARVPYVPVPMPYLPAFALFFLPMAPLSYIPSYFVWIALNLGLIVLYMIRFKRALGPENGGDILMPLLVCLPVFSNTFLGQVNGWMLICLGEFFLLLTYGRDYTWSCRESRLGRALTRLRTWLRRIPWLHTLGRSAADVCDWLSALLGSREFRSGLWLGGLLLKPQTLILILPGLLLSRRFRTLLGFGCSCLLVALVSVSLAGGYGLGDLAVLILHYVRGLPTNAPEAMMNWRAVAFNLDDILPRFAWAISMGGLIVTAGIALSLWVRPSQVSRRFPLILFGTYAATCAATWHSHTHMLLPLIPLLLYLYAKGDIPWPIVYVWLLGPPIEFPLMLALRSDVAYNWMGLSTLALNMVLLLWVSWIVWRREDRASLIGGW